MLLYVIGVADFMAKTCQIYHQVTARQFWVFFETLDV